MIQIQGYNVSVMINLHQDFKMVKNVARTTINVFQLKQREKRKYIKRKKDL